MKIIEPSYEIWDCPDGEATLAKIERIGRECYKSEGSIHPGRRALCPHCGGQGKGHGPEHDCPHCDNNAMIQVEEPSSHAFMRMILRTNRRERLIKEISKDLLSSTGRHEDAPSGSMLIALAVQRTLDDYRDDPPHDGLLEHASVTVHFTVSRGFTHELVRHRHGSYAQECVAGSTKVTKKYTIKELFERQVSPYGKTHNKTIRLRSCGEDGTIIRNKIAAVMYKGRQPTQRVTTKLGYVIEATGNHEFMLPDGSFACLGELDVGDYVMVNGRPSLLHVSDKDLRHDKLHHGWHVGVVAHPDEIVAIGYVGEQDVYDIEMAAPYPNYVANGFVVHNSTRYCNYAKGKFGSSITVIKRSFELEEQIDTWMHGVGEVESDYMKLIKLGVKAEIARDLLTQATKAGITLTANFNSLRNFFRKRCSPRAHPDMRSLMTAFRDDMRKRIPIIFEELV